MARRVSTLSLTLLIRTAVEERIEEKYNLSLKPNELSKLRDSSQDSGN